MGLEQQLMQQPQVDGRPAKPLAMLCGDAAKQARAQAALDTLVDSLQTGDCIWFDGPPSALVMGTVYSSLSQRGDTVGEAVAPFVIGLAEWIKPSSQVAWRQRPTVEKLADGWQVRARFAVYTGGVPNDD